MKNRFAQAFRLEYSKLEALPPKEDDKDTEKDDHEKLSSKTTSSGAGAASEIASKLAIFRRDCESFIDEQLEARLVMLTADGTHEEIVNTVTSSRLYNNLANSGSRLMGFYDVKNATLCDIYEGEALTQREPALDENKFKAFLNIYNSIMKMNGDICWIMAGRCDSNVDIIKKAIALYNWKFKVFSLVYDSKLLQKWYWRRMRGLANSKNLERLLFCWKGRLPTNLPKHRQYLDAGSPLYCEVMLKVPVVAPKDLAFVSKEVRDASLATMSGIPVNMAGDPDDQGAASASADATGLEVASASTGGDTQALLQHVKKRRLYRQATGTEVVWFPHDNSPLVLKELLHESGTGEQQPRWVLHGTPASSSGVLGLLEMGASVVGLCEDTHHLKNFMLHLREKCVESLLGGSAVFNDAALTERSNEIFRKSKDNHKEKEKEKEKETETEKTDNKDKDKDQDKSKDKDKDDEKPLQKTPNKEQRKSKKRKPKLSSSSSSASSSFQSSEKTPKKPKKR